MSYTNDLLDGLAVDLAALGVGVYEPNTAYSPGVRGIVIEDLPQTPDEVVAIGVYATDDLPTYRRDQESVVTFVQIRLRLRSAAEARDLQDQIRDRYHRRRVLLTAGATQIGVTGRQVSRGPLGPDGNLRHLFTQNFSFTGLQARS